MCFAMELRLWLTSSHKIKPVLESQIIIKWCSQSWCIWLLTVVNTHPGAAAKGGKAEAIITQVVITAVAVAIAIATGKAGANLFTSVTKWGCGWLEAAQSDPATSLGGDMMSVLDGWCRIFARGNWFLAWFVLLQQEL